jgi:predicted oxidoreductase
LIGTQREARIKDAAGATAINLTARQIYDLVEAYRGVPMP